MPCRLLVQNAFAHLNQTFIAVFIYCIDIKYICYFKKKNYLFDVSPFMEELVFGTFVANL